MTGTPVRLAVPGAGLIGRRHIEQVLAADCAELMAIVDPTPTAQSLAAEVGAVWYPSFAAMLAVGKPDGAIVAIPNRLHVENGLECVAAGVPALIEKPIADDVAAAIGGGRRPSGPV
jgi:predicted dehydrogenase